MVIGYSRSASRVLNIFNLAPTDPPSEMYSISTPLLAQQGPLLALRSVLTVSYQMVKCNMFWHFPYVHNPIKTRSTDSLWIGRVLIKVGPSVGKQRTGFLSDIVVQPLGCSTN
jgi:hypothetical protein